MLTAHGFSVTEEPFTYSTVPGRWATPTAGVAAAITLALAAVAGGRGRGDVALAILAVSLAAIAWAAIWMARRGVLTLPLGRARSVNLVATRGAAEPAIWLVAHLDSKSQPVPMLARITGIVLVALTWSVAIALAAAEWRMAGVGAGWAATWLAIALTGSIAALPIIASTVGARSPGALDDASGVATVLESVDAMPRAQAVGVVFTSAEELGLAGARSWARGRRAGIALNVDGVDDSGALTAMYSGARPERLVSALMRAPAGDTVRMRRLLPGVLTDGVALAEAGWKVVTLSKGTFRTLVRIHRPADSLAALRGDGVREAAALIAALVPMMSDPLER